jgi:hypothetical protein
MTVVEGAGRMVAINSALIAMAEPSAGSTLARRLLNDGSRSGPFLKQVIKGVIVIHITTSKGAFGISAAARRPTLRCIC